jgi:integrase
MARTFNLFRRGDIWWWRKKIDGRVYRRSTGFEDLRAAERRAAELDVEARKEALGWTRPKVPTFGEWVKTYVATYGRRKKDGRRDRFILAHVLPRWAGRPLDEVSASDCYAYLVRREDEGAAQGTIAREVGLVSAIFRAAVRDRLIERSPWDGIKRPRYRARTRVLSLDEQAVLVPVLNAGYQRLLIVTLGTGLRERELLGLTPEDVIENERLLKVRSETAKGGKAREVPLLPEVIDALNVQAAAMKTEPGDHFWTQCSSAVVKYLQTAAKRAGIPPLCMHDLRRTFGTRCAVAGMPLPQLQRIMGHHSAEVTMKYYVHLQRNDLSKALAAVDLGLGKAGSTERSTATKAAA